MVAVTGTESQPAFEGDLSGSGVRLGSAGADHIAAKVSAKPSGGQLAGRGAKKSTGVPSGSWTTA